MDKTIIFATERSEKGKGIPTHPETSGIVMDIRHDVPGELTRTES